MRNFYFFTRYRGYLIVVYTTNKKNALDRLVEYVRITKGNIGYSESDIRRDAKVDAIDFIDDIGTISKLGNLGNELAKIKSDFIKDIDNKMQEVEGIKRAFRELVVLFGDDDDY